MADQPENQQPHEDSVIEFALSFFLALTGAGLALYAIIELLRGQPWDALSTAGFAILAAAAAWDPIDAFCGVLTGGIGGRPNPKESRVRGMLLAIGAITVLIGWMKS